MKKTKISTLAIICLLIVSVNNSWAFNYVISFTGSGASTTVGDVQVQNLTNKTSVVVPAGSQLNLSNTISSVNTPVDENQLMHVYQNSSTGEANLTFYSKQTGNTEIALVGLDGKKIISINKYLETGKNTFLMSLPNGISTIQVIGNAYSYASKVLNQFNGDNKPSITFIGNNNTAAPQKVKNQVVSFTFNDGDRLLFKAISGNCSTIISMIPTGNIILNFVFVVCQDADGNNYSVVKIGDQTWMAENLKTTKFQNNDPITNITDNTAWTTASGSAYCDYANTVSNSDVYGRLYNLYTINDSRIIVPVGWHVPTYAEWNTLINYLVDSGAGDKVKETGTSHWLSPNNLATNESGFTALPSGYRLSSNGAFGGLGDSSYWGSSSQYSLNNYWVKGLYMSNSNFTNNYYSMQYGFSVRCISN